MSINANWNGLCTDTANNAIRIGFDAGTILKAAVADGPMYGGATRSPYNMSDFAICALGVTNAQQAHGFNPGACWYDATNINHPDIAMDLYD